MEDHILICEPEAPLRTRSSSALRTEPTLQHCLEVCYPHARVLLELSLP